MHDFFGSVVWLQFSRGLCFRVSHETAANVSTRAMVSFKGSNEKDCVFKFTCYGKDSAPWDWEPQFLAGNWLAALSVPCHVGLSTCSSERAPEKSQRDKVPANECQGDRSQSFVTKSWKRHAITSTLIYSLEAKHKFCPCSRGAYYTIEWMPGDRAQILGSHFKATCQNNLSPKLGAGENWPPCLLWRELWFRLYVQERN